MEDITQKFTNIYNKILNPTFLKKEGISGEISFYISPYDPHQELAIQESIKGLIKKLENKGIKVLELNLYDLICEILEKNGGIERMFKIEQMKSKEKFVRALQSTLNIHQVLMPTISEKIAFAEAHVYFLTGIGLVYPYFRSHNILNNLQNVAKDAPMVAFFPGEYNGLSLNLFGLLKDDNYYRAFNIDLTETTK
jgi:Domain of unknown function (DUF1788)